MPPAGFEPTISAGEQPQTDAFDRTATGTGTSGSFFFSPGATTPIGYLAAL